LVEVNKECLHHYISKMGFEWGGEEERRAVQEQESVCVEESIH
jgi:hypothetical protein